MTRAKSRPAGVMVPKCPVKGWRPYSVVRGSDQRPEMEANAQLIARCSPDTLRAVMEALEVNAKQGCDYSRAVLALLRDTVVVDEHHHLDVTTDFFPRLAALIQPTLEALHRENAELKRALTTVQSCFPADLTDTAIDAVNNALATRKEDRKTELT